MKVEVKRKKIVKKEFNRVLSNEIYKPYSKTYKLSDIGLFSSKIFGSVNVCSCGETKYNEELSEVPQFCPKCKDRVVSRTNLPDYYINLPCKVLQFAPAYSSLDFSKSEIFDEEELIADIMSYKKFIYMINEFASTPMYESTQAKVSQDEIIESNGKKYLLLVSEYVTSHSDEYGETIYSYEKPMFDNYGNVCGMEYKFDLDVDNVMIGEEALLELDFGVTEEWLEENTVSHVLVSHPMFRPIIRNDSNSQGLLSPINEAYIKIISKIKKVNDIREFGEDDKLVSLAMFKKINEIYEDIVIEMLKELQENKTCTIKTEMISHPITNAVRAVLLNRHDLHEDVMLIGDTLIETLFPLLYKKYNGNMAKINAELVDDNYFVLINRPPSICHLSLMAMKPRVASMYPPGKTEGTNYCLERNIKMEEEVFSYSEKDLGQNYGDTERYVRGESKLNCDVKFKNEEKIKSMTGFYDANGLSIFDKIDDLYIDKIGSRCVGMNLITADGLAADTDGDCLLEISLFSKEAKEEAEQILPSKTFLNFANMEIRNSIIGDYFYHMKERDLEDLGNLV